MPEKEEKPARFVGLDVHKHYLVPVAVDRDKNEVMAPRRVQLSNLDDWVRKNLTHRDAVVLEMTTNTFQLYDELLPHVHSVTVVHPPHVALITRAQVMTDKIAARTLARLHAAGLLPAVWVPPEEVRDHRALVAQRAKMMRLATQARNRLHAVLHRHHILPPGGDLFAADKHAWWLALDISTLERVRVQSDLDTLRFAWTQIAHLEKAMAALANQDPRSVLLLQLPGVGLITAITLLAAIGNISRFPTASHLVGYAGLGGRVHDTASEAVLRSGQTHHSGRITKAGRRDIRAAMVEAAHTACRIHPHWQAKLARLEPRLGKNKTIVAIARKLLVAVWHILTKGEADCHAMPERLARKLLQHAYRLGRENRQGQSTATYVRAQLDQLGVGADLTAVRWDKKRVVPLPPSSLKEPAKN
jgi:transposase